MSLRATPTTFHQSVEQCPAQERMDDRTSVNLRPDGAADAASDEQLLADFLAGDQGAFAVLVHRYGRDLFQFVARFTRDVALTEDIVQDTFLQVYQSAGGFDSSRALRPWLFTIAANKARDQLRGRMRRREVPMASGPGAGEAQGVSLLDFLSDEDERPHEAMEAGEQRNQVRRIVSEMPESLREVLVLGYYHRFPYKEIAEILSVPLGTVKSRLHTAVSYVAAAYKAYQEREQEKEESRE